MRHIILEVLGSICAVRANLAIHFLSPTTCGNREWVDGYGWLWVVVGGVPIQPLSRVCLKNFRSWQVCFALDKLPCHLSLNMKLLCSILKFSTFTQPSSSLHFPPFVGWLWNFDLHAHVAKCPQVKFRLYNRDSRGTELTRGTTIITCLVRSAQHWALYYKLSLSGFPRRVNTMLKQGYKILKNRKKIHWYVI